MPATLTHPNAPLHFCNAATPAPQQGCPSPPQIWQVPTRPTPPLVQTRPSRHALGLQHGSPVPPHCEHIVMSVMRHEDWDAVHKPRSQHGSPTLPHDTLTPPSPTF